MPAQYQRNVVLVVKTAFVQYHITALEILFDVLLRKDSKPNTARIDIYNLSRENQGAFQDESQFTSVELYAGYDLKVDPPLIFSGTASNIATIKSSEVDFQTTIWAGDGYAEFDKSYFSKTYDEGIVLDTILSEIASALGLDIESNVPDLIFVKTKRPITLDGKAKDVLDKLTAEYDLDWSVQFGSLNFTKAGEPPIREIGPAVVLGPNSGLLGSPTLTWAKKKKNKKSKPEFVSTLTTRANLNASIRPHRIIEMRAKNTRVNYGSISVETVPRVDANGFYLVDQVRYRGDNRRGPFEVEVTADGR